jgi:two-component system CheB/CheR fusion protein
MRDRLFMMPSGGSNEAETAGQQENPFRLNALAYEAGAIAQVIVDASGRVALANGRARAMFNLTAQDLGRPVKDLELSYRPVELQSVFEKVYSDYQPVKLINVEINAKGSDTQYLDIEVKALMENANHILGLSILFEDVTGRQKLQADLQRSSHELAALGEAVESTHEELETTNEELQSTNEELETTNEELQATNEELETTNEELHSTNVELEALNTELGQRTEEANQSNAFLQSILASLRSGVIVLDDTFNLLLWNKRAEDLWGLRTEEVQGKSLYALDIGMPVEQIPLRAFVSGGAKHQELTLAATNRRGKTIQCHIMLTPFLNINGERKGVVLLIEET